MRIFEARPPMEFKPPAERRKPPPTFGTEGVGLPVKYTGIAAFCGGFESKEDYEELCK